MVGTGSTGRAEADDCGWGAAPIEARGVSVRFGTASPSAGLAVTAGCRVADVSVVAEVPAVG